jgi:hypothetical protein
LWGAEVAVTEMTFDELVTPPAPIPEWVGQLVASIKLADHLGDVWDALLWRIPDEGKMWVKRVCYAQYLRDSDSRYSVPDDYMEQHSDV